MSNALFPDPGRAPVILAGTNPSVHVETTVLDEFSDVFSDTFGVTVVLTTIAVLPGMSPAGG